MRHGTIAGGYRPPGTVHKNRSVERAEGSVQALGWSDFEFEYRGGDVIATSWKGQRYASALGYNEAHAASELVKTIRRR